MALKWYQDGDGDTSTMRIIAMMGACVGALMCVASLVSLFMNNPQALTIASLGAGLLGVGEISKAIQAQAESRG